MNWLISANSKVYDHASSFEHFGFIDWKQGHFKFEVNDIIYIYTTAPVKKILYKTVVEKNNMLFSEIRDDEKYWFDKEDYIKSQTGVYMKLKLLDQVNSEKLSLDNLLLNGLVSAPQGAMRIPENLLQYIQLNFNDYETCPLSEELHEEEPIYEGLKKTVTVNKYERNSIARAKCIEYHGSRCCVCLMSFEEVYGEIGKGFVHVHHVVPVSEIGKSYKVDYKNDLKPVCPNCHAMLHTKNLNGKFLSIEELKTILKK